MRELLKKCLWVFFSFLNLPSLVLYVLLWLLPLNKNALLTAFSQFYSLWPGKFGCYLRATFYHWVLSDSDNSAVIGFATLFSQVKTEIGAGVYIGPQCNIGSCRIGRDTLIGSGVHILSGKGQHDFSDPEKPIREQGGQFTQISIGEDCWIGNQATIMANLGKKSVVAAGAVVIHDVPDYAIVAGNPAKVIKYRSQTAAVD